MRPTRRTVTAGSVAVVLAASVPIVANPVVGIGAAILFGWLIAQQLVAVRAFQRSVAATSISVEPSVSAVKVNTEIPVTVHVKRPAAAAQTKMLIAVSLPPAAKSISQDERTVQLESGETEATTTVLMSFQTAGRMTIAEPRWELEDTHGLFTESLTRGPSPTVTAEAQTVQNLHVGQGGDAMAPYGQHSTNETGDGLTPTELRQYVVEDPADRIDWKATARLPDTYVREFESETDREVTLIFDHRSKVGTGIPASQLAYLREIALGIVDNAESVGDPLGFVAVGNEGLTTTIAPSARNVAYTQIRDGLIDLQPTIAQEGSATTDLTPPAVSRELASQLTDDDTPFGNIVRAFADTTMAYTEEIESDPLFGAIEYINSTTASQLTIILTNDTDRTQLLETIREAASGETAVLVFLTPEVLFEGAALADIESAYHRYHEFEEYRQMLQQQAGVIAYEVAPGDRLATLLATERGERAERRTLQGGSYDE